MGMFESSSPGVAPAEGGEAAEDRYPAPPPRSYRLPELLRLAGLQEQVRSLLHRGGGQGAAGRACRRPGDLGELSAAGGIHCKLSGGARWLGWGDGSRRPGMQPMSAVRYSCAQPPQRCRPPAGRTAAIQLLSRLLAAAQAASAPDLEISALLTCNSISPAEEGSALYVCVPSADGYFDGHDWADEVRCWLCLQWGLLWPGAAVAVGQQGGGRCA